MSLLKGTLDILVLKTLSWGPMHAFEISTWLEERSHGAVRVTDAAMIQALHRLEARKVVSAEWGITVNERRARYYRLTAAGRARLKVESEAMMGHVTALAAILTARSA